MALTLHTSRNGPRLTEADLEFALFVEFLKGAFVQPAPSRARSMAIRAGLRKAPRRESQTEARLRRNIEALYG